MPKPKEDGRDIYDKVSDYLAPVAGAVVGGVAGGKLGAAYSRRSRQTKRLLKEADEGRAYARKWDREWEKGAARQRQLREEYERTTDPARLREIEDEYNAINQRNSEATGQGNRGRAADVYNRFDVDDRRVRAVIGGGFGGAVTGSVLGSEASKKRRK